MARVDDLLSLIDDPTRPADNPGSDDDPLLALLVHLAFSDEVLQEDELALLERVRPGLGVGELLDWAMEIHEQDLDLEALAAALPTAEERWSALRISARMICMDGDLDDLEVEDLKQLAAALGLGSDAVRIVVREVIAEAGTPDIEHLMRSLSSMFWEELVPTHGGVEGELSTVVPDGADPICAMHFEDIEVAGLYHEGLAVHFETGPEFVRWTDVERYTRVPVPGAALHLRMSDGSSRSVADPRLRDIGQLLDRIYGVEAAPEERPGGL
ncbi:MAG: TerB family tellurite resistance protein [Deltaproteobacteria bacterium]|nr:MAG: TerB family tellurite resistance protein [Deltaproteobacteria bacterium]